MDTDAPLNRSGMRWARNIWGLRCVWTTRLDKKAIGEAVKSELGITDDCTVRFLAGGAFNKLYVVNFGQQEVVARITLPIDPVFKTQSEVATLLWVSERTDLPVPRVLGHSTDRSNPVGFEWIIMNKVQGKPWADIWQDMEFAHKEGIVRQIAKFRARTFDERGKGIGSLFRKADVVDMVGTGSDHDWSVPSDSDLSLQRMVSGSFIACDAIYSPRRGPFARGPFATAADWLTARLDATEADCRQRLVVVKEASLHRASEQPDSLTKALASASLRSRDSPPKDECQHVNTDSQQAEKAGPQYEAQNDSQAEGRMAEKEACGAEHDSKGEDDDDGEYVEDNEEDDSDDEEDLEQCLSIVAKLRYQLPNYFPVGGVDPEPSMLIHDDLSGHNILVDEQGGLGAVVDGECVSFLPLPIACDYPSFLQGDLFEDEPIKSQYTDETGEVAEMYLEHLEKYELTRLRSVFIGEMRRLQPEWVKIYEASQRQRDFVWALEAADDVFMIRRILGWLVHLESGKTDVMGLEEWMEVGMW